MGWDHGNNEDDLLPVSIKEFDQRQRSAKDALGKLHDFRVSKDGKSAEITLDIHDEDANTKAEQNTVSISPVISPHWVDGKKNKYTDLISHVDFVTHPVDHDQGDFEPVADGSLACALRMNLDGQRSNFYRLGDHDMADEDKKETTSEDGGGDSETETIDGSEDIKGLVDDVLAKLGVEVPGEFDPLTEEGLRLILTAMLNKLGGDEEMDDTADLETTSPEFAALSLQARTAHNYAEVMHRDQFKKELQATLEEGRCTPDEHKTETVSLSTVKLSLDSNGKPSVSRLELWLASRARVPKGTFWSDERKLEKLSLERTEPPKGATGVTTKEDAKSIVDKVYGVKS